jgi:hypothetical protein
MFGTSGGSLQRVLYLTFIEASQHADGVRCMALVKQTKIMA